MKRIDLLVIAVAILALLSFGCDSGSDDAAATTVLGASPTISGSLTEITESGEVLGAWESDTYPVILAINVADESSGVYVGMDEDGDSTLSIELDEPSVLYPVTDSFPGAEISNEDVEVFPCRLTAYPSLDTYQTRGSDADDKFVGLLDITGWEGQGVLSSWEYMYADAAVTISGTALVGGGTVELPVNLSLQPGWNVVYAPMDQGDPTKLESTPVSSAAQWYVGR